MIQNLRIAVLSMCIVSGAVAQQDSLNPSNWRLKGIFNLQGTQSSFVNWNAGGRNNISVLGAFDGAAKYKKKNVKWDNDLGLSLGGLQYLDKGADKGFQKTDDRIDLQSNVGYEFKKNCYISFISGFRTQFLDGFTFPDDSVRTSTFMAPGYLNLSLGIEYSLNNNFSAFLSPVASKLTFVNDQTLADMGAFGVLQGERLRTEFGAYLRVKYDKELMKNINMKSKWELFSNYKENPQNIDVNAEVLFLFKVNKWFSASLNWNLIYDHDIRITDAHGKTGPRTQFKSVLGLGFTHTVQNYKEPVKK